MHRARDRLLKPPISREYNGEKAKPAVKFTASWLRGLTASKPPSPQPRVK